MWQQVARSQLPLKAVIYQPYADLPRPKLTVTWHRELPVQSCYILHMLVFEGTGAM